MLSSKSCLVGWCGIAAMVRQMRRLKVKGVTIAGTRTMKPRREYLVELILSGDAAMHKRKTQEPIRRVGFPNYVQGFKMALRLTDSTPGRRRWGPYPQQQQQQTEVAAAGFVLFCFLFFSLSRGKRKEKKRKKKRIKLSRGTKPVLLVVVCLGTGVSYKRGGVKRAKDEDGCGSNGL